MKTINKYLLEGGYEFPITFEIDGESIKIIYEYRTDIGATSETITTESEIASIIDDGYYNGIENLNQIGLERIISYMVKEGRL